MIVIEICCENYPPTFETISTIESRLLLALTLLGICETR